MWVHVERSPDILCNSKRHYGKGAGGGRKEPRLMGVFDLPHWILNKRISYLGHGGMYIQSKAESGILITGSAHLVTTDQ